LAEARPAPDRPALLSLVPTQLQRLIESAEGRRWLACFALIWVGGAALPPALAERCRRQRLRMAPCYGSTETGAMVTALAPQAFLAGAVGCGPALPHAQLRLAADGALEIRASSLAAGCLVAGCFQPLPLRGGWWASGDRAAFTPEGLQWQGRLDGAISSGGETVFPEQVQAQLLERAAAVGLPLEALLVLPEADPLWGERLVGLVRPGAGPQAPQPWPTILGQLEALAGDFPPSQRPRRWLRCPELAVNAAGKWDRSRWQAWLQQQA
jgi:O-succinylbenzoic acid--CoA ligase